MPKRECSCHRHAIGHKGWELNTCSPVTKKKGGGGQCEKKPHRDRREVASTVQLLLLPPSPYSTQKRPGRHQAQGVCTQAEDPFLHALDIPRKGVCPSLTTTISPPFSDSPHQVIPSSVTAPHSHAARNSFAYPKHQQKDARHTLESSKPLGLVGRSNGLHQPVHTHAFPFSSSCHTPLAMCKNHGGNNQPCTKMEDSQVSNQGRGRSKDNIPKAGQPSGEEKKYTVCIP